MGHRPRSSPAAFGTLALQAVPLHLLALLPFVSSIDNGVALVPPLGWSS